MTKNTKNVRPVVLVILDGWGIAPPNKGNAIALAKTPTMDYLMKNYPCTTLSASGRSVGLPSYQPGNSEAGHLNLGAGRIVRDDSVLINESIKSGTFFKGPAFVQLLRFIKETSGKVHLIGLVTERYSAHSLPEHWKAIFDFFSRSQIKEVYLHFFTDGRDAGQHAAIKIINDLLKRNKFSNKTNNNKTKEPQTKFTVASICGRFYAMDRTKNWPRTKKAYDLIFRTKGYQTNSYEEAILQAYNRGETDEFIGPTVIINKDGKPLATVNEGDAVIFMNLRSDRVRQLTKAIVQKEFNQKNPGSFYRKKIVENLFFVALTDFGPDLENVITAYPSFNILNSLPMVLGNQRRQVYLAETGKYAHVSFFFNGGYDHPVAGEERICIPSVDVVSDEQFPKMRAGEILKEAQKCLNQGVDFLAMNFANPDMLGHTGNIKAAIEGIEYVDKCLSKLIETFKKVKAEAIIVADHGNAEEMLNLKTGEVMTTHTTNPVPFVLFSKRKKIKLRQKGILGDVAPTILTLFGVKKPRQMSRRSLII